MQTSKTIITSAVYNLTAEEAEEIVKEHVNNLSGRNEKADLTFSWDKMYEGSNGRCSVTIKTFKRGEVT